ncbi:tetratricopeptide repeat-containing diguanylate cyclase [Pseudoalteromonas denitrificans]|nr:diguanylate cyclase [Pseudoalteromonas denitrificans]
MFYCLKTSAIESHPVWLQESLDKADKLNDKNPHLAHEFVKNLKKNHSNKFSDFDFAAIYSRLATYQYYFGNFDESLTLISKSKKYMPVLKGKTGVEILLTYGSVLDAQGSADAAITVFHQAIDLAKSAQNNELISESYNVLAAIYAVNHNDIEALKYFNKAYILIAASKNELKMAYLKLNMANSYTYIKDFKKAILLQNEAIDYFKSNEYFYDEMLTIESQATTYLFAKNYDKALLSYQKVLELSKSFNDQNSQLFAFSGLSKVFLKKEEYEKSFLYWSKADELIYKVNSPYSYSSHLLIKAKLAIIKNKIKKATTAIKEAEVYLSKLDKDKNVNLFVTYFDIKIDIAMSRNDFKSAYLLLKKSSELYDNYHDVIRENTRSKYKIMFDTEQAELKNQLLEKDKKLAATELENSSHKNQIQNLVIIIAVLFIIILVYLFHKQIKTSKKLNRLANTDELTQLANRRYSFYYAERALKQSQLTAQNFSIIIFDIDHFKYVNDTFGHLAGDNVLIAVAKVASGYIREKDVLGRVGGEEFLAVLSGASSAQAYVIAQRIKLAIEDLSLEYDNRVIKVTASFGIAQFSEKQNDFVSLFQHADEYLYKAKNKGRNCIVSEFT